MIYDILVDMHIIDESEKGKHIDLIRYITSSEQFIKFVIALEKKFQIELPEQYLVIDKIKTVADLANIINEIKDLFINSK